MKDHEKAFGHYDTDGVVKRFLGIHPELGFIECNRTKTACTIHTGVSMLERACDRTNQVGAMALLRAMKRDPAPLNRPLML